MIFGGPLEFVLFALTLANLVCLLVGFGGSMMWFGSSAAVAISSMFPQSRPASAWLRHGWHVTLAYIVGFAVMAMVWGWHPSPKRGESASTVPAAVNPTPVQPVNAFAK